MGDVLGGGAFVLIDGPTANMAAALPSSIAPAIAPVILAFAGGSYGVLYTVAGACAIVGGVTILRVKGVR